MGFTDETVRFDFDDSRKKEVSETLAIVYRGKRIQSDQSNRRLSPFWRPGLHSSLSGCPEFDSSSRTG